MRVATINPKSFQFLNRLSRNNNREWFAEHKIEYESARTNVETFVNGLIERMNQHDQLETNSAKESLYRIYNDVRFSADKTPYNPRFAGYLRRAKPMLRGGYYYWIRPGGSRAGCGFVYPNSDDLRRVRQDIDDNFDTWKKLLKNKGIISAFGAIQGDRVKTAPKGYSRDNAAIELLQLKQYWFERAFTDKEVLAPDFLNKINKTFKSIRPFFDYMSLVLTTNANGETLV